VNRRLFLTSAACAAAGASALPARAQFLQQITIGINAPLSGDYAAAGKQLVDGATAAVLEVNQNLAPITAGGTGFAIRPFDDRATLGQAILNVQFGASDPSIVAMIGGVEGALLAQTVPQYANVRMPLFVAASTADAITARGYRNVWRLPTKDSTEGSLCARYIVKRRRPKVLIAITQDGPYGPDVARGFSDQAAALGAAAQVYTFPHQNPDYAAAAKTIMTKEPDFLYLCGTTKDLGPIVPALHAQGYSGAVAACEGFYNQSTIDQYGSALNGATISTSFPPLDRAPLSSTLADFRARTAITALTAFAYAAMQIIMSASRRAGALNRLTMLTALRVPIGYDTIVGPFQFNAAGDPIDPHLYFYTLTSGKLSYLEPSHAAPFLL